MAKTPMRASTKAMIKIGNLDADGSYPSWAWPGGYPLYYVISDGQGDMAIVHPDVANDASYAGADDRIVDVEINWEDPDLYCELSDKRIPSAYAERD
jgi:hypothetical protein